MKNNLGNLNEVYIAGAGITQWGYFPDRECKDFGTEAVIRSLEDAGMEWKQIQGAFCGSVYQGTGSGHQALNQVGLTGIPIINIENACSSASSAFRLGYNHVAYGINDIVIVLGMEKMPKGPIPSTAFSEWELKSGFNFQPGNYALAAKKYIEKVNMTEEDFSLVTVKNRKNGSLNPNARFQKPVTLEEVINSRLVADPLRLLHCCPLADGAVAFVLCNKKSLKKMNKPVSIEAAVLKSGYYGEEYPPGGLIGSVNYFSSKSMAVQSAMEAYEIAGVGPEDVDLAQVYDAVAPSEMWEVEELGLCDEGEALEYLVRGNFDLDGEIPINTDGGLIARGHPLGASAGGQIYELLVQLRGEAGKRQVEKAKIGLSHSMGAGPNSTLVILKS
ncbi:thiolase family protein [Natranaerofaba carboxydovora]|uniref:thiolase family protein n=1 Tax=Natranaerofaba carboxydovora TaxID=2742683 RepID=UPI001F14442D|nr:thiolase family protein [Natranaerofaba carboxydovora]UMZ74303.1 Acetyl-CoA acetyltransferase [Natranaerofaba carboxydovora]